MKRMQGPVHNRLIEALSPGDRAILSPGLECLVLETGETLFEPGEEVMDVYFPGDGTIASMLLNLQEGTSAEAALVGVEGAIGGIISEGDKPAFARSVVQIGGAALKLSTAALEDAKQRSATLRDHFACYADCLLAQVMQSVACNAAHTLETRLAKWLLELQDRVGTSKLPVTQEFVAQMLGVQRTYVTRTVGTLQRKGTIEKTRGVIHIADRAKLEAQACECYLSLRDHYDRVLPGVYPRLAD